MVDSPAELTATVRDEMLASEAVGREMGVRIVLPPGFETAPAAPYPVLYLLHPWGLSPRYITDKLKLPDHLTAGVRAGDLAPFVVALPEGGKSFYVNALDPPGHDWSAVVARRPEFFDHALEQYGRYGDYLLREVIPFVEMCYPVRRDRAGRAIGGISMGGTAAAVHAFHAPGTFCAVGIHSPAIFQEPPEQSGPPWIFGTTRESFARFNPADVARELPPETDLRIWLDTAERDPMLDNVAHLHARLEALGIPHAYSVCPGGHDKRYWEPRMRDYLRFYAEGWPRPEADAQ